MSLPVHSDPASSVCIVGVVKVHSAHSSISGRVVSILNLRKVLISSVYLLGGDFDVLFLSRRFYLFFFIFLRNHIFGGYRRYFDRFSNFSDFTYRRVIDLFCHLTARSFVDLVS